jgi:pre-mRNA-processing factor 19
MICSLSGEAVEEPVVSTKTGHIYEKRIILKWLETNSNKDPHSDDSLSLEDLIPVKANRAVKPRPTTATSIPSMLALFQNEWDALMLETYSLKEQLDSVRQELSHSLYQHDAACRVIARLIKERDDARNALANFKAHAPQASAAGGDDGMEVEGESGINEDVKAKLNAKSKELSKGRKDRTIPENLATAESIKEYEVVSSNNIHKTTPPGVLCLDIHPTNQSLVVTGGHDGNVIIFDRAIGKVSSTLSDHGKAVTDVLFHPTEEVIFSTSKDKTAKVWKSSDEGYQVIHTISNHKSDVSGCSLHATGDFWVTGSLDMSWAFHDLQRSQTLARVEVGSPVSAINFHPDGLILGTGTEGSDVKTWDVKTQKNVATFEGHTGTVSSLSFSENGYYLATAAQNVVKLWDLRKLKNFHSLDLPSGHDVTAVDWDYSGTYLAVASEDIRVYIGKTLNHVGTFSKHNKTVTDVKWGHLANFLASCSLDRSLKVWGIKEKKGRK